MSILFSVELKQLSLTSRSQRLGRRYEFGWVSRNLNQLSEHWKDIPSGNLT